MEIWLKESNKNSLRLPVLPSEIEIPTESLINTVNINELGEVALFGGNKLSKVAISSFFPKQIYSFVEYSNFPKPYDCVKKIEEWRKAGKAVRLIITGANINIEVLIDKFSYKEKDGSGDVYYTIDLIEYKKITITKVSNSTNPAPTTPTRQQPAPPKQQRTHKVVSGDTLWGLAVRYYGNGSKYTTIHNANKDKIKNPNLIYPGQVLVIP